MWEYRHAESVFAHRISGEELVWAVEVGRDIGGGVVRQREGSLPLQAPFQEVAHRAIGRVAAGQSHPTGVVQTLGPVLLGQSNDPLTLAQVVQGVSRQEFLDHLGDRRTEGLGLQAAPVGGPLKEAGLFGGVVLPVSLATAIGGA